MSNSGNSIVTSDITSKITIAVVILNFAVFLLILILYFRAKGFSGVLSSRSGSSRRLIFAPYDSSLPRRALDPAILNALPVTIFKSEEFAENGGLECAVCITELTDGEKIRLLPKCQHGFHVECIDMWFSSNTTCPLCRIPITAEVNNGFLAEDVIPNLEEVSENGLVSNAPITTNLNEVVSSSSSSSSSSSRKYKEGMLVIDIPRRKVDGVSSLISPLPLNRQSPRSPLLTGRGVTEGMKSLRRILSRGNGKGVGLSLSPRGCEIEEEQGGGGAYKCQ